MSEIVLFGAGGAGRWALKTLRGVVAFADNDRKKKTLQIEGIPVYEPAIANGKYPEADWVACSIRHDYAKEIRREMKSLGVKSKPLWECLPVCHGVPSKETADTVDYICCEDKLTRSEWYGQIAFRESPDYDTQTEPSDLKDLYFPDFIDHVWDEHFVDCGAADGDTVQQFQNRWTQWRRVTAIEPDYDNFRCLQNSVRGIKQVNLHRSALSDHEGWMNFQGNGDFSSHLAIEGADSVCVTTLDALKLDRPTYIKMDIEGSEPEALWGARETIRKHRPVLAVCAYHQSDHLWTLPLLIHAIEPEYRLFFRRYAEGAFELVWYAVPPERVL